MTAIEFIQSQPGRLKDWEANKARFGNSPEKYLQDWVGNMDRTFGADNWNRPAALANIDLTVKPENVAHPGASGKGQVGPPPAAQPAPVAQPAAQPAAPAQPAPDFNDLVDQPQQAGPTAPPQYTPTAAPPAQVGDGSPGPRPPTQVAPQMPQPTVPPVAAPATPVPLPIPSVQAPALPGPQGPTPTTPAMDFPALVNQTASVPTLPNTQVQPPALTPPSVPAPTVTPPANVPAPTTGAPQPLPAAPGTIEQLMSNPQFASLPPAWQQEIATQVQQNGLDWALQANSQWASENPNDPFSQALAGWTTSQGPLASASGQASTPNVSVPGANYNMQEAGNQSGSFSTVGSTNQVQQGQQASNSAENQVSASQTNSANAVTGQEATTQNAVGTNASATNQATTGTTTGQQVNTGTNTGATTVTTPFDIQSLVRDQLPQIQANDTARSGFLTDFMNTGGTAFNSQVDQAVRNSLTGPRMTGAGESAQARAAGYAGAQVARNNADQRLQAAQQLSGPTGLGTATEAFSPLYGTATTGTNTGVTNTTGTNASSSASNTVGNNTQATSGLTNTTQNQVGSESTAGSASSGKASNTVDFQSLVGNEAQAGTAVGSSAGAGSGVVPQGQPVKTGGCVVCTAYSSLGQMHPGAIRRAVAWKLSQPRYAMAVDGYMLYGPTLARWVANRRWGSRLFRPVAREILYHECYLSHPRRLRKRWIALVLHEFFDCLSKPVGFISRMLGLNTGVRCPQVRAMLQEANLSFKL